jgi:K+-sensing histidine kinase KdpD
VLPAGSVVLFREPGPWDRYRGRIIAIGLFVVLQTSLIVGLLISRGARRKSEEALKQSAGERVLTVRTKGAPEGGVQVIVEDTGPGIPTDQLDAVFTPFHSARPGGLGMGLAICRTILTALGGSIRADAGTGRGARLRFVVPAAPEGEP